MTEITKQRILNVGHTDSSRYAIACILNQAGFDVMEAASGKAGLILAAQHPDLILLDVNLPDLSGFEVCKQLKTDPSTCSIPVLYLSAAHVDSEDLVQGMEGGADGYLTQPVEAPLLVARIRAFLRLRDTQAALRESEERFRSLTALSSDFYWETDCEHRLTLRSEGSKVQAKSVFSAGPRLGERRWEVPSLSPDAAGWQAHQAALDAHQPFSDFCFSRRSSDGTERHVSISGKPLFDISGVFKGYHGVGTDITAQVKSDIALAETEARFRATFEQAAVGIAHVAPDGRWLRVNQKLSDIVGYTREELLGRSFLNITHPDDLDGDLEHVRQLLTAEITTYVIDKRYLHKNGEIVWVHLTVTLIRQDSGEPDYLISVIEDITTRKRNEQKLIESEERFRGLVEQSLVGIYMSDGANVHYINPRAEEILGYDAGGLTGASLTPLVMDQDRPAVVHEIRRLVKGETAVAKMDFRMRCKDGSEVEVGAQCLRTNVDGRPAIIGVMQDISEKKRAEAEIKRYVTELEIAFMSTVEVATYLSELRDPYTVGHERRVADIAVAIGGELGLDARHQEGLRVAGYLHDIGKIAIPAEILSKPGKLGPIEFLLIKGHAQASYEVLKNVQFPWSVAEIVLQHHERMDGSGYPQGLKGEAILLEARILAVADVIEAMSSHRPYRAGLGIDKALAEIESGRGSTYDPQVVDACLRLFRDKAYQLTQ
jgi:PAS domain S-box-containing protein/putative nucleotidyltransferase with HDIG domain